MTPIVTLLKPYSLLMSVAVLARLTRSRYVIKYIRHRRSRTTQRTWLCPDPSCFSISIPPSTPWKLKPERFVLLAVVQIYTAPSFTAIFFLTRLKWNRLQPVWVAPGRDKTHTG